MFTVFKEPSSRTRMQQSSSNEHRIVNRILGSALSDVEVGKRGIFVIGMPIVPSSKAESQ